MNETTKIVDKLAINSVSEAVSPTHVLTINPITKKIESTPISEAGNQNYVEKATYIPLAFNNTGVIGSLEMDKKSALKVSGTITEIGNIIKNVSSYFYIGQFFIFIDNTDEGNVKLPHLYTGGGSGSIAWFHPDEQDYYTTKDEVVLFTLDVIGAQKVYRRISFSLKDKSVTLVKIQDFPASTLLGNNTLTDGQPQLLDVFDVLQMLGLQDVISDLNLKADQATTYTKAEVDAKVSSIYKIRGSVANFASLPTTGQLEGDVWNLLDNGDNYAWVLDLNNTGIPGWDKLSGAVDLSAYETKVVAESKYLQIVNASTAVLATLLSAVSFATGGAITSSDSVLIAFGKIQKQINDLTTSIGLKQDTLTDINFGAFNVSVTAKPIQVSADSIGFFDSVTSKWVKQTFTNLVTFLGGFFQKKSSVVYIGTNTTLGPQHEGCILIITAFVTLTIPTGLAGTFVSCALDVKVGQLTIASAVGTTLTGYYSLIMSSGDRGSLYKEDIANENYRLR